MPLRTVPATPGGDRVASTLSARHYHPMRTPVGMWVTTLILAGLLGCSARPAPGPADPRAVRQFTFAWPFRVGAAVAPRGGTTHGDAVTLAPEPSAAWHALQEPGLTPLERDRRAILAMTGTFRASFDFLEVAGFRAAYAPDRPYQSWGTEIVFVLHDEPRFISLQHLLVMFMRGDDGTVAEPVVVKHWRQDWRYEDRELLEYQGRNTWATTRRSAAAVRGAWTQAVFQVDDSPRYESVGRWEHFGNVSSWRSDTTWRPLPRREFSARKDYEVLVGTNRHTITPTGWIQEEENLKVVLGEVGRPIADAPVLAKELGLNRYERITGFDTSAGDRYRSGEPCEPRGLMRSPGGDASRSAPPRIRGTSSCRCSSTRRRWFREPHPPTKPCGNLLARKCRAISAPHPPRRRGTEGTAARAAAGPDCPAG
jgi:hypothetical protein